MKAIISVICLMLIICIDIKAADPLTSQYRTEIVSIEKVPIISVELNGKTAYFVLDSGSDVSLLHDAEADKYEFISQKRASKSIFGVSGGKQAMYRASDVNLQIGGQPLRTTYFVTDLSLVVASLSNSTGFIISGIIGMDLMRRYGFEIDYANLQLKMRSPV